MPTPTRLLALLFAAAATLAASGQTVVEAPDLGAATQVVIPQARAFSLGPRTGAAVEGVRLDGVEARVVIRDRVARTTLEVAVHNPSGRREQAVLLLPVPDGAVVSGFAFDGAASEPTARLLPKDEARRLYDSIVARVMDPALLEFAGYNLIRTSVFPVEPGQGQRVRLTYEHLLDGDGDRVDYVLPRSESLDQRRPWKITVSIASEHAVSTVYSPSHALVTERTSDGGLDVRIADAAALAAGPFRLSYLRQDGAGVSASLFAYPDPSVGGGYFLLMAGLPARTDDLSRVRREVTFVLDRSGSMAGTKMDQAKVAARQVIEGLADGESFNIIDYSNGVSSFAPRPVVKDRANLLEARAYLDRIRPAGGTNIHDAMLEALRPEPTPGTLPIVLFLTDGLPTIGRTSERTIRDMVETANVHGRRVFTFGVGEDVNAPLLDRVAASTRGTSTYVLPDEDVEVKVAKVFNRLYGPVFADLTLTTHDTSGDASTRLVRDLMPHRLPDLYEGDQLILLGQYQQGTPMTLALAGSFLGEAQSFRYEFDPATATTRNAFVPRLWASRRIAFLVDEIRQNGAGALERPGVRGATTLTDARSRELIDEIMRLSTEFGILTEYTSFLATEGTDLGRWNDLVAGCANNLDQWAVKTRSGRGAVMQSMNTGEKLGQIVLNYDNRLVDENLAAVSFAGVQQMCDRAFFRRGNRWIDSKLIGVADEIVPHETLMLGSEAHTRLLRRLIREGRPGVLSLPGEILLMVDGRAVLITDGC